MITLLVKDLHHVTASIQAATTPCDGYCVCSCCLPMLEQPDAAAASAQLHDGWRSGGQAGEGEGRGTSHNFGGTCCTPSATPPQPRPYSLRWVMPLLSP